MENVKNRIITLSGQPATGKSTVKNILIQKYEDMGFEVKQFATGDKFREYFNDMKELLVAVKNKDSKRCEELSQREGIRKIMYDNNGSLKPESMQMVKDTLRIMEERNFNFNSFDIEKANNSQSLAIIRKQIDFAIDNYIKNDLRNEINFIERPNVIWIIDSRLAWSNIPKDESFSIRLTASDEIAGERAYKRFIGKFAEFVSDLSQSQEFSSANIESFLEKIDNADALSDKAKLQAKFEFLEAMIKRSPDKEVQSKYLDRMLKVKEESYENLDKAIEKISARKQGENERYERRYHINLDDPNNYKLVIDTSRLTPEEEAEMIIEKERESYSKNGYKDPNRTLDTDEYWNR